MAQKRANVMIGSIYRLLILPARGKSYNSHGDFRGTQLAGLVVGENWESPLWGNPFFCVEGNYVRAFFNRPYNY